METDKKPHSFKELLRKLLREIIYKGYNNKHITKEEKDKRLKDVENL